MIHVRFVSGRAIINDTRKRMAAYFDDAVYLENTRLRVTRVTQDAKHQAVVHFELDDGGITPFTCVVSHP